MQSSSWVSIYNHNSPAGPRNSEDNRAYASLETNTETDQTADTDASESNLSANRRRRSRRRRTDNDATLIDGESDNASVSENGIGKERLFTSKFLGFRCPHESFVVGIRKRNFRHLVCRRVQKNCRQEITVFDDQPPLDEAEGKPQRRNRSRRRRIRPPEERQPGNHSIPSLHPRLDLT